MRLFLTQKMNTEIVKTYMIITGHNDPNNKTTTAVFSGDDPKNNLKFPEAFVSSTNRRFITVMPPTIVYGNGKRTKVNNEYIMHCSFIYRDPFHEKACMPSNMGRRSKYKKYEYKANYDTFDIIFTHNQVSSYKYWLLETPDMTIDAIKENIKNKLSEVIFNDEDLWDVINNIQTRVTNWKTPDPDNPNKVLIDYDTNVTPETEAIVPLFNGYYQGGFRTTKTSAPFSKAVKYMNKDIWAYAFMLEYKAYMKVNPNTITYSEPSQRNATVLGVYYDYTRTEWVDEIFGKGIVYEGVNYKLYETNKPWSFYAEFLLQY